MRLSKFLFAIYLLTAVFSCKKDSNPVTFTPKFYIINGGTSDTTSTLLLFSSSDTVTYNLVMSSTFRLSSSALISIAVSDEARIAFNLANGTNYQAMPSNAYSFRDTLTAPISSLYDTITVSVFKHALLASESYLLPIRIISAGSFSVDSAYSTIYLRTVNNVFAGIYVATGVRTTYNGNASDTSINSIDSFSLIKSLVPVTANSSTVDYADLGINGWKYITGISAEDSSFFVSPNDVMANSIQTGSFKVIEKTFDSTTKNIYFKTSYKNLSGDERIVEESLTLQ